MEPDPIPLRARMGLTALLLLILVAGLVDVVLDDPADWRSGHVAYELLLIAAALGGVAWLWLGWWRSSREVTALRRSVAERQAERDAWRADAERALAGFASAIDGRFAVWGLTPAERDVALAILKGKTHREIAAATHRSERTVRQHAIAVYQKSGLGGRAELAAFFLEDLMLPPRTAEVRIDHLDMKNT
jgi:DNA-binding CsgD family transcriptional regulator